MNPQPFESHDLCRRANCLRNPLQRSQVQRLSNDFEKAASRERHRPFDVKPTPILRSTSRCARCCQLAGLALNSFKGNARDEESRHAVSVNAVSMSPYAVAAGDEVCAGERIVNNCAWQSHSPSTSLPGGRPPAAHGLADIATRLFRHVYRRTNTDGQAPHKRRLSDTGWPH